MDYRERWGAEGVSRASSGSARAPRSSTRRSSSSSRDSSASFWYLQIVKDAEFALLAENNRLRRIALPPTRGVVLDRSGEVLASTRPALNLVLVRGRSDGRGGPAEAARTRSSAFRTTVLERSASRRCVAARRSSRSSSRRTSSLAEHREGRGSPGVVPVRRGRAGPRSATIRTVRPWPTPSATSVRSTSRSLRRSPTARSSRGTSSARPASSAVRRDPARAVAAGGFRPSTVSAVPSGTSQQGRDPGGRAAAASLDRQAAPARKLVESLEATRSARASSRTRNTGEVLALASTPGY